MRFVDSALVMAAVALMGCGDVGAQVAVRPSVQVVAVQASPGIASAGRGIEPGQGDKLIQVRISLTEKSGELLHLTTLDFTIRYVYPAALGGATIKQPEVRACLGVRWHGRAVDESRKWLLLSVDGVPFVQQISSGNDYLDLLFAINERADDVRLRYATEVASMKLK